MSKNSIKITEPDSEPESNREPETESKAKQSAEATTNASSQESQDDMAQKAANYWEQLVRTTADFENFKKRAARERAEAVKYASAPLLQNLLTILDNFEMALAAADKAGEDEKSLGSLKTGVAMIFQQFKKALTDAGLTEIDALNQPFDPNYHEAVSQLETHETPEDHVHQQLRKGYQLHDRLLRAASVVVAKPPAKAPKETPDDPESNPSA